MYLQSYRDHIAHDAPDEIPVVVHKGTDPHKLDSYILSISILNNTSRTPSFFLLSALPSSTFPGSTASVHGLAVPSSYPSPVYHHLILMSGDTASFLPSMSSIPVSAVTTAPWILQPLTQPSGTTLMTPLNATWTVPSSLKTLARAKVFQNSAEILLRLMKTKPSLLQHGVKHLFIGSYLERSAATKILTTCTHITHLFAPFNLSDHIRVPSTLWDVATDIALLLTELGALHSLFQEVTELELLLFPDISPYGLCERLALTPNLAHLALNSPLHVMNKSLLLGESCFLCFEQKMDWRWDWLRGARPGDDYWAFVDEFLAARRAKKLRPTVSPKMTTLGGFES
ncbi:hypothetical protein B0H19DRAFT_1285124 [Mycena capillaripes]|nr:hypothetical protein B0H19DRAFT_1285124 [Mycena capillaripes]